MGPDRRRNLIASRRRVGEEEDDEDEASADLVNDSQSEGTINSDAEEGVDPDESDEVEDMADEHEAASRTRDALGSTNDPNAQRTAATQGTSENATVPSAIAPFSNSVDTDAMMAGLKPSAELADEEALEFEDIEPQPPQTQSLSTTSPPTVPIVGKPENPVERKKRAHEEYIKQRDSNPAFVPNRGGFFMHDQRSVPGMNGGGIYGRGRGRGRVAAPSIASFSLSNGLSETTNGAWHHDLHETVNDLKPLPTAPRNAQSENLANSAFPTKPTTNNQPGLALKKNTFSKTIQMGTVNLKVFVPSMKEAKIFSGVPVKQHTRLPDLRPPLRRDKPVRIAVPFHPPRYHFPRAERSFVFIPRAERPNHQSGRRSRPRGGLSQQGSRRTSVQGGSAYTPSISMSRRSSRVQSPAGSITSRAHNGPIQFGPPVVRLPVPPMQAEPAVYSPSTATFSEQNSAYSDIQHQQTYPLPQDPAYRENRNGNIPMYQPRPQKTVSVAGIESPTALPFPALQQQEQQPFHHQVPAHMNGRPQSQEQAHHYPHARQLSYPSQGSGGTPLSNIPERAIHAQPFQPSLMPQQGFYPQMYPMQNMYYYSSPAGQQGIYGNGAMSAAPVYMQQPQQMQYMVPMLPGPVPGVDNAAAPPGTLGHDGTTYFYDPSQGNEVVEGLAPASYAVPGMGGMLTPSPDGYFYGQPPPQGNTTYTAQDFVPSR